MVQRTLSKFGVPKEGGQRIGMKMPKPKWRFRALFTNFGFAGDDSSPVTLEVVTAGVPSWSHEEVAVHGYNSVSYYAGKHTFNTIDVVVRDTLDNSVEKLVARQAQKQFDHYNQLSQRAAENYKFTMRLQSLDGSEDTYLDSWYIEGAFVQSFNFGDWDYSDSSPKLITMTIRYDNAILYEDENADPIMVNHERGTGGLIG